MKKACMFIILLSVILVPTLALMEDVSYSDTLVEGMSYEDATKDVEVFKYANLDALGLEVYVYKDDFETVTMTFKNNILTEVVTCTVDESK